jgi:PGM1 C-terminal domain
MRDLGHRMAHADNGRTGAARHREPVVRAMQGATAHPAPEAWPGERFARLQDRLAATADAALDARRRAVVVLPSRSVDRWHEPPAETRSYEERMLSTLLDLRDPRLELTYVTSSPVAPSTVDYYLSLLPARCRASARRRLRLVALGDDRQAPLSEKLLAAPRALDQIRAGLTDPRRTYLLPYNSTALERDIALSLDTPLYGADPSHAWLGTKSGARRLFAAVGVPHPLGAEGIRSIAQTTDAICSLRVAKPELTELLIKIDNAVSGEGNAVLDVAGLPAPGAAQERELIHQRLARLEPEADGIGPAAFLDKLAVAGGVVEERITARELRSPSVQLRITPRGGVELLSTHDQILDGRSGQQFAGSRFPADVRYAPLVSALARRIAEHVADLGVIGHLGIDFLVARDEDERWHPFALELNLRLGGTTHPFQTLIALTQGSYDPHAAIFRTPRGDARHYVSLDHVDTPRMRALGHGGLLARAMHHDLRFDHRRGRGVVFHMLSSIEPLETVGVTAIAESSASAEDVYARVGAVLKHSGERPRLQERERPRIRPALDTAG